MTPALTEAPQATVMSSDYQPSGVMVGTARRKPGGSDDS